MAYDKGNSLVREEKQREDSYAVQKMRETLIPRTQKEMLILWLR